MNNKIITIPPNIASEICWPLFHRNVQIYNKSIIEDLEKIYFSNESLRLTARYNTGSISLLDGYNLVSLSCFFGFESAAEVGTFIGNSTNSIAYGMALAKVDGRIYTCDASNEIDISLPFDNINLTQYKNKTSTLMFKELVDKNIKVDLLYLDGRLQDQDFEMLPSILESGAVVALDDFEGIEKGVVNMTHLCQMEFFKNYITVYPCNNTDYLSFSSNPRELSKTALMIPASRFIFTRQ